jgi:hypothetical protein
MIWCMIIRARSLVLTVGLYSCRNVARIERITDPWFRSADCKSAPAAAIQKALIRNESGLFTIL